MFYLSERNSLFQYNKFCNIITTFLLVYLFTLSCLSGSCLVVRILFNKTLTHPWRLVFPVLPKKFIYLVNGVTPFYFILILGSRIVWVLRQGSPNFWKYTCLFIIYLNIFLYIKKLQSYSLIRKFSMSFTFLISFSTYWVWCNS